MMGMPRFSRTRRIRASSRSSACFSYPPYCCVALMAATLALGLCAVAPNVTQAGEPPGPQDDARVRGGRTVEKSPPAEQSPYVKITTELGVLVLYVAPQAGRALDQQSPYSLWWRDDTTEQIYLYGRRVFDRSGLVRALISLEAEFGPDPLELAQAIGAVSFSDSQREFAGDDPLWLPATRENVFTVMNVPFPDSEDAEPIEPPAQAICPPCSATLPDGKPFGRNPRNASDDDRVAIKPIAVPLPDLSLDDIIEIVILEACGGCGGGGGSQCLGGCDDGNPCTNGYCQEGSGGGGQCAYQAIDPEGVDCDPFGHCSTGPFQHCNNVCCPAGQICCNLQCSDPCSALCIDCDDGNSCTDDNCVSGWCTHSCTPACTCASACCSSGQTCCNGVCCVVGKVCTGGLCCNPEEIECNGACCDNVCCNGVCCVEGKVCTGGLCCNPGEVECNGVCCVEGKVCTGGLCCDPGEIECNGACCDNVCCNGVCCVEGKVCTGGLCCNPGEVECNGGCCQSGFCCQGLTCCSSGQNCCSDGTCCNEVCDECIDNGTLSGGTISANPPVVCLGDTITFTISGVVDNGGIKKVDCNSKTFIAPVSPTYTWIITKPDSSIASGTGTTANVLADQTGTYSITYTATASRECPPDDITVGPFSKGVSNLSATLSLNPSTIPAKTAWPAMT